ncbi:uncharacterized protein LOC112171471 [Rosa chinensis]|uniref:uncharacterized protein LOC112171471 n=1 Tax=Rosa chinensis TaxID=74649 RepID=UPI000D093C8F|nr:uncharacterized protein LOC112171471 [Rosa chinensis]
MENLLRSKEYWNLIETGYREPAEGEAVTAGQRKVLNDMKLKDLKVRNYLLQSIDKSILKTLQQKETSKHIWDCMKLGETVADYFGRVMTMANEMRNYGEDMPDVKIVEKILRTLTERDGGDEQALKVTYEAGNRGRGQGAMRRNGAARGRGRGRAFNKEMIECFKCHQLGHFQHDCPKWEKATNYAELDEEEELLLMAYVENNNASREENKQWFAELDESYRHSVKLGNNMRMPVMGKGSVKLQIGDVKQVVSDVYYIPDLTNNLFSRGGTRI